MLEQIKPTWFGPQLAVEGYCLWHLGVPWPAPPLTILQLEDDCFLSIEAAIQPLFSDSALKLQFLTESDQQAVTLEQCKLTECKTTDHVTSFGVFT